MFADVVSPIPSGAPEKPPSGAAPPLGETTSRFRRDAILRRARRAVVNRMAYPVSGRGSGGDVLSVYGLHRKPEVNAATYPRVGIRARLGRGSRVDARRCQTVFFSRLSGHCGHRVTFRAVRDFVLLGPERSQKRIDFQGKKISNLFLFLT